MILFNLENIRSCPKCLCKAKRKADADLGWWAPRGSEAAPSLSGEREGEMREKRRRHRDTKRRRQSEDGGRVWSDAATSQGISRHQSRHVTRSYKK